MGVTGVLAVLLDIRVERYGYVELVWVWVGRLCFPELLDGAGTYFKILLRVWVVSYESYDRNEAIGPGGNPWVHLIIKTFRRSLQ